MRTTIPILVVLGLLASSCRGPSQAEAIIDRAIAAHGGEHLDGKVIDFDFREYHYRITLDGGRFQYEREREDSVGFVRDVLDNDGFYREIDGRRVELPDERSAAYFSSVNSVAYFMLLPFKLADAAVQPRYLAAVEIDGEPYHEIEVTFRPQDGGRDYQDRFVYWFHRDRHTMDYLAYDYVTDETGTRFRRAYNQRSIGGLRFQDYENYTSSVIDSPGDPIERLDSLYQAGELELVSRIESENITVRPVDG